MEMQIGHWRMRASLLEIMSLARSTRLVQTEGCSRRPWEEGVDRETRMRRREGRQDRGRTGMEVGIVVVEGDSGAVGVLGRHRLRVESGGGVNGRRRVVEAGMEGIGVGGAGRTECAKGVTGSNKMH